MHERGRRQAIDGGKGMEDEVMNRAAGTGTKKDRREDMKGRRGAEEDVKRLSGGATTSLVLGGDSTCRTQRKPNVATPTTATLENLRCLEIHTHQHPSA